MQARSHRPRRYASLTSDACIGHPLEVQLEGQTESGAEEAQGPLHVVFTDVTPQLVLRGFVDVLGFFMQLEQVAQPVRLALPATAPVQEAVLGDAPQPEALLVRLPMLQVLPLEQRTQQHIVHQVLDLVLDTHTVFPENGKQHGLELASEDLEDRPRQSRRRLHHPQSWPHGSLLPFHQRTRQVCFIANNLFSSQPRHSRDISKPRRQTVYISTV